MPMLFHPFNILRHVHPEAAGRIAFKKGGGNTTSTVTQQDIPEEFFPYFERLLIRGEEESLRDYTPYKGQRIAATGQDVLTSRDMIRDMAANGQPGLDYSMGVVDQNLQTAHGMVGQNPYQFSAAQFSDAGTMTPEQATAYMSPYMQNVVDIQKQQAAEDYQIAQAGRNADAVSAGAFGGSRQAVMEGMAQRDMLDRQAQIQAQGLQSAYEDAAARFEADRQMRYNVEGARAGELGRVQGSQAAENRAANEFDLAALGFSSDQAGQIANLTEAARAGDIQAAQLLEAIGRSEQGERQARLDLNYDDFMRQQGWNQEQLGVLSSLLRGLPIQAAGTTTSLVPYNPIQQALGAGISALGLYRGLTA